MREIYRSPRTPGVTSRRPDGSQGFGSAGVIVRAWDPGESVAPGFQPKLVAEWRKSPFGLADGSLRVPAPPLLPPPIGVQLPVVVIPASALDGLPAGTLIEFTWGLDPRGGLT